MHIPLLLSTLLASCSVLALPGNPLEERKTDGQALVDLARKQVGLPYVWGGGNCHGKTGKNEGNTSPKGFDCSGLNKYVICHVTGTTLPHHAATQYVDYKKYGGKRVKYADAEVGDMYFFANGGKCTRDGISHTNIKGKAGKVINAPQTGRDVSEGSFWKKSGDLEICPYAIRFW